MTKNFENAMLELTSTRRKILLDGESLIKQKRIDLGVYDFYDLDALEDIEVRSKAMHVLDEYGKHLLVERDFYKEFHRSFIIDVERLLEGLPIDERGRLRERSFNGLKKNNEVRMEINALKQQQNNKIQRLVQIYNFFQYTLRGPSIFLDSDSEKEIEKIFSELDSIAWKAGVLTEKQKLQEVEGRQYLERLLEFLKKISGGQ